MVTWARSVLPRIRYVPLSAVMLHKVLTCIQLFVSLLSVMFHYWSISSVNFLDRFVPIMTLSTKPEFTTQKIIIQYYYKHIFNSNRNPDF